MAISAPSCLQWGMSTRGNTTGDLREALRRWRRWTSIVPPRIELGIGVLALALAEPSAPSLAVGGILAGLGLGWRQLALAYGLGADDLPDAGPYRLVRHPRLLGAALMTIGVCLAARSALAMGFGLVALTATYCWRARRREAELGLRWGADWVAYREQVPAFMPQLLPAPRVSPRAFDWRLGLPTWSRRDGATLTTVFLAFALLGIACRLPDRFWFHIAVLGVASLSLAGRALYGKLGQTARGR